MRSRFDRASMLHRVVAVGGLAFMHFPVLIIILYSFTTEDRTYQFPPPAFTTHWYTDAFVRHDIWEALLLSLGVATCATLAALLLGSLTALGLARSRFWGREAITLALVLPIALPGIVTGISLLAALKLANVELGFWTIVLGHATFCLVIIFNNVIARLRRLPASLTEASMDLGADGLQTLRYVLFPQLASALLAGAMLAFALSFDEIIVTLFTAGHEKTLPIWIYDQLFRPRDRPLTNVVAVMVILITMLPIVAAYRLTRDAEEPG